MIGCRRIARGLGTLALTAGLATVPNVLLAGVTTTNAVPNVEAALTAALEADLNAVIPAGARLSVALTVPVPGPVSGIRNIVRDPRSGIVQAFATSNGHTVELRARTDIVIDIPVPNRRILPGEVIEQQDLAEVTVPYDRLTDNVITDPGTIVGMAGRRPLYPGRPIQSSSVGAPVVVQRNRPVKLIFNDGMLSLTAKGRALQDGGVGDLVRVMNVSSSTVVTGTVSGPRTVSVNSLNTAEKSP